MREIKFRAWDKEKKMLRKVTRISFSTKYIEVEPVTPEMLDMYEPVLRTGHYELMQYTGLKDKNGVEIYEGDVLFHPLQGRRKVFYPYSETVASYGLRDIDNGFGSTLQDSHAIWEVIGNIYENQELLEREGE